jgi:hypothetical protein
LLVARSTLDHLQRAARALDDLPLLVRAGVEVPRQDGPGAELVSGCIPIALLILSSLSTTVLRTTESAGLRATLCFADLLHDIFQDQETRYPFLERENHLVGETMALAMYGRSSVEVVVEG